MSIKKDNHFPEYVDQPLYSEKNYHPGFCIAASCAEVNGLPFSNMPSRKLCGMGRK